MKLNQPEDATPIRPEDLDDLIPDLKTQEELNEFEQRNIALAEQWAAKSRKLNKGFPSSDTLKLLHEKMFDKTWKWAGDFRLKELTIGIEWSHISTEVKKLCDDVHYRIANNTYSWDEIAVRFHHRLVFIHPFQNGNGRHARLATDLLFLNRNQAPFTWGSARIDKKGSTRDDYIRALKAADKGDFSLLLTFARS